MSEENFSFDDFSIFSPQTAGCTMLGTSGPQQYPIYVVIGKIGDSGIKKLFDFISQRGQHHMHV
jgi:hypothetical protein